MSAETKINFLQPTSIGLLFLISGSSIFAQEYPESSLKVDQACEMHSIDDGEMPDKHLDIGISVENNPLGEILGQVHLKPDREVESYIIGEIEPGARHFVRVLHGEYEEGRLIEQGERHTLRIDFSDGTSLEKVFMTLRCL